VGFPESGNRGYNSISECIDAWQGLCVLGIHPHPVDPAFAQTPSANAACFVNTSPRKSRVNSKASSSVKREMGSAPPLAPAAPAEDKAQVLADL
jgi:hypothetical protein